MNDKLKTILKWVAFYTLMVFVCLELAFRILGYSSFYNKDYSLHSSPKNAYIGHPTLGIQLNPGTYKVRMNKIVKFTVTHNKGNNRFVPGNKNPDNPDVLFLGCSFTYGHGVNDADNFPAMVQVEHPELSIKNGGVIGYGTVQSLLQLKEEVKKGNLKVVLLNFSAYHFKRNSMSQSYRSDLRIGYKRSSKSADGLMAKSRFPFKRTPKSKIEYVSWESMYSNWPGRSWLASVNGIQSTWDKSIDNGIDEVGVAESLINEIAQICEKNNIKFGMVCLNSTDQTKKLKKRLNSIPWLNINFNFHSDKYTNPTGDIHPNRKGHALIAKRIEPFLKTLLNAE